MTMTTCTCSTSDRMCHTCVQWVYRAAHRAAERQRKEMEAAILAAHIAVAKHKLANPHLYEVFVPAYDGGPWLQVDLNENV